MELVVEMGVKIRKCVTIPIRTSYRSVCNHPFLVVMLLFLICLHRVFPYVFSLLVTASPVFVCSAVLLGTLLIFGQPNNIPEIEKEQKSSHDIASLRTGVSRDGVVVVERDGGFSFERFSGKTREIADSSEAEDYGGSVAYVPLIDESLQHNQSERRAVEDMEREIDSKELESRRNIHKEKVRRQGMTRGVEAFEKQHSLVHKVRHENREPFRKGDHLEPSLNGSCDDDADDDEASDTRSDSAESSSPDASMADILPILDELHPLLELEAPHPALLFHDESDAAHLSHDESDAASNMSNDGSNDTYEDVLNQRGEVEEYGGDEEEAQGGKDDESKSAIKWTEDDQKNVMDLGNLELERNQWLETLIARRRATKSFCLTAEKNLIDLDSSDNPFNVTPLSTTRHNPFDPSYDSSYESMGLPPIPGSAPSILLPRRNPFHLPYEPNEEKPDLKGDHFEQGFMTFHPKDTFFSRHESFSLGPSSFGDAKKERQDFKWRPVFVPEQLGSEGTSYSSLQRQSSDVSDSKLSSTADTESVSSAADMDDRKFSEQDFTKEAEVISNIYHAYDLVGNGSQSSEDVDSLEMERAGKREAQHDELEIKLGKVENLEPSLSGTGGSNPVEITNGIRSKPRPFKGDNSSRSSLSSVSEIDERFSDVRKGGTTSLEPRGDHATEFGISPQPPLEESESQFTSVTLDDNQHKEPIYDSSPPESEKILSFDSISSDMQVEISKLVPLPASAGMRDPSVEQDSDLHGESKEKGPSEADVNLPNTLDVKAASSNYSYQNVPSKEKQPTEQEKDVSWSDKPRFDDHSAPHEPAIILPEPKKDSSTIQDVNVLEVREVQDMNSKPTSSKEIASSTIESGFQKPTTTHNALKQVSEGNVGELPKPSDSKDGSKKLETNAVGTTNEIASSNTGSSAQETTTTQSALKEVSERNVSELPKQSNSKDGSEKVETIAVGSKNEAASNITGSGVQEAITSDIALKQVSEGNVGELPKPSDSKNGSAKVETNAVEFKKHLSSSSTGSGTPETITIDPTVKKVSEGNVGELPKPTNSKDGFAEVGTNAVVSTKEIASRSTGSDVQETINTHTSLKQVSEGNLGGVPKQSDSEDGSTKIETNAVGSTKEVASSNAGSGVQGTITTHTALKQVSEGNAAELPKPSDSKDESTKTETNVVGSTKGVASSNAESGVQENITTHSGSKQVSESNAGGLSKPANSKDESKKVGISAVDPTKEIASTITRSSVHQSVTTDPALKQVSEGNAGELPKPSDSKDESTKTETNVVGSTKGVASRNAEYGVQETITTHSGSKQVSDRNVGELPTPSNSKDGSEKIGPNAVGSTKEIASNNTGSSADETITAHTALKQVSEGNVGGLPKPSDSRDGQTKVGTSAVGSTKEVTSSNAGSGVQETSTIDTALKQVSYGNVSELPKSSNSKDGSENLGTSAVGSSKEISSDNVGSGVQDTVTTQTALKQVSESNLGELPKPSDSKDGSAKVGTNEVGSTKEVASSSAGSGVQDAITTHTSSKQVSECDLCELPKLSDQKVGSAKVGTTAGGSTKDIALSNAGSGVNETITTDTVLKQVSEGNVSEVPKPSNSKDGSEKLGASAVDSTKAILSINPGCSVHEAIITDTALKQVSEGNVGGELSKPLDSKDESTKVGSNAVSSTEEVASTNAGSGVQETISIHTDLKQVPEGNLRELPNPSNSKDELTKVGINAVGSSNEIALRNTESGVQETITTHTALNQVSESNVSELRKPSSSKDASAATVGTNAVGSTKDIASSNTESGVPENITNTALKQDSNGNVGEIPKPSDSKDGSTKVGTSAVGSTMETASNNTGSGAQETITTDAALKQVSEGNVSEVPKVPKPSNLNDGSTKVGTSTAGSPKEIGSSNTKSGVPGTMTNVDEPPKPSDLKDGSTKVGTIVVGSTKDIASSNTGPGVQDTITTHTAFKEVSNGNAGEPPKPSDSKDGSTKEGTNAVGSTKEIASSNVSTNTALKQVSDGN
ncbi:hypothetical protein L3X38_043255 [Prunus dulcis]|uniref:Uncharacterized protein n=1 Tax=Prunus dulcis TaxID=3755 RepID=A0AAD4YMA5_PRUDU|nr:hypothetical protein L3X38_043255 [Prunus dulcis]